MTKIRKNATKTLKEKKNAARQKRKLILFQARLVQLKDAGVVTIEVDRAESKYTFREETLANVRELQRQTGERTANKINSLQRYDDAVLMLYPTPASLNELAWPNKRPITDPDMQVDVFKFAEYLGFTRSHARYILDQEYAGKLPTYTSFCMSKDDAITFTAEHGGLYFLYQYNHNELAREHGQSLGVVTRASVSVRCPVPYMFTRSGDKVGSRYARVRCKINIPGYDNVESDPTKDPYKFDGFVTPSGSWWQWLLQARPNRNRGEHRGDLMVMYTEAMVDKQGYHVANGIVLTQHQGGRDAPGVSRVVLVRHPGYDVRPTRVQEESTGNVVQGAQNNARKNYPEYLDTYYTVWEISEEKPKAVDEREFMRGKLGLIDPASPRNLHALDEVVMEMDRIAMSELFSSACRFNGLNLQLDQ